MSQVLSLSDKLMSLGINCSGFKNITLQELIDFLDNNSNSPSAPKIVYLGGGGIDVAQTNAFQYNSSGSIWFVSRDGAVLQLRSQAWFAREIKGHPGALGLPAIAANSWTRSEFVNAKVQLFLNELLLPDEDPGGGLLYYTHVDNANILNLVNGTFLATDRVKAIVMPI
jgi:hypothetical protein